MRCGLGGQQRTPTPAGSLGKPHLFGTELNRLLISAYRPAGVLCPGLGSGSPCERLFGLKHLHIPTVGGVRVVEIYFVRERLWLFTKLDRIFWSDAGAAEGHSPCDPAASV